jgi:hypothetical protein
LVNDEWARNEGEWRRRRNGKLHSRRCKRLGRQRGIHGGSLRRKKYDWLAHEIA